MSVRRLVIAVVILMALVPATVAWSKGADQVTLADGTTTTVLEGLAEPGSGTDMAVFASQAGLYEVVWEGRGATEGPATTDLGLVAIEAVWRFPGESAEADLVLQMMYPFAVGGPMTYVAPGQEVYGRAAGSGWWVASDGLIDGLRGAGFDLVAPTASNAVAPVSAEPVVAAVTDEANPRSGSFPGPAAILAVGALLALIAVMRMEARGLPAPGRGPRRR